MTNKEISKKFSLTGKLMELHGENKFKARSYSNAAFNLSRLDKPLEKMSSEEITRLNGVGDAISKKIEDLLETGSFKLLDELRAKTPEGIMELLQIKGLGAGKLRTIWKDLGVETPGELLYACKENRLAQMKGFGQKTQQNVQESLEYYLRNRKMFHYYALELIAEELIKSLQQKGLADEVKPTGAYRRKCIVLDRIDILLVNPKNDFVTALSNDLGLVLSEEKADSIKAETDKGVPVTIHFCEDNQLGTSWIRTTGSEAHLELLGTLPQIEAHEEQVVYEKIGKPWVEPELREGRIEFERDHRKALIEESDIKGVIHNHSTWSDGSASVEEMARACIDRGYEYLVMSDHSKSAFYAHGLEPERLLKQMDEIDAINEKLQSEGKEFKVYKSIESDIFHDGSLDYEDDLLNQLDLVIASVHSGLRMDEEKAMMRLIKAIEHPATKILGHMTGRLLLSRPGYPVDHEKIIDACIANGVCIEINANPMRLDMDWTYVPMAMEKGAIISINPDAHSTEGIDDIHFGVLAARKGGLTSDFCLNARGRDGFEQFLKNGG